MRLSDRIIAQAVGPRAMRDAAVAVARRAPLVVGPNVAERGLVLAPGEFKSVDTNVNTAADTTGGVTLLNGMARGDDINQRQGRQVTLRSIELRLLSRVAPGTGIDQRHRILIVYDRQTNGAAPAITDILSSANVLYPRNLENRQRFRILFDRLHTLNASGEPGSGRIFKWYRRLNHPVTFNAGAAGTVADIQTGSLYAIVFGTEAPGGTAGIVSGIVRVRYSDN